MTIPARQLGRLLAAMLIIGAFLSTMIGAPATAQGTAVDTTRKGYYTVEVDGQTQPGQYTGYTTAHDAAVNIALANPDAVVIISAPYWVVEVQGDDSAAPVDPPVIEPPIVEPPDPIDPVDPVDPPEGEVWLSAAATSDDILDAASTGKDVMFAAGAVYTLDSEIKPYSGQRFGVHGEGDRPRIECVQFMSALDVSDIEIVGLWLYSPDRNPWSASFDFNAPAKSAISLFRDVQDVLVEDCKIEFFDKGISIQDVEDGKQGTRTRDITIHRCIIRYNWNGGDRGAGIYTNRVRNVTVTENLIDHNGWHPDIASGREGGMYERGNQAHGCYFSGQYPSGIAEDKWDEADTGDEFVVEFHRNIVSRSSANGVQFRLGGNVSDNVFVGNPMAFYTWTNPSSAHRNAVLNGTHIDASQDAWLRGWGIQVVASGEYSDNLVANVVQAASGSHAIIFEHPGATVHGNTIYNWRQPGKDSGIHNKNKLDDDEFAALVYGNTDVIEGLITTTLTPEQIEDLAKRPRGVWSDEYDGAAISAELREAYQ